MTPMEEARQRATEIAQHDFNSMFVSISLGGEYINSYDVEAKVPQKTVKQLITEVQQRLNALGQSPRLQEDGILGPLTLNAILKYLPSK
jgi:lysozyme family protein